MTGHPHVPDRVLPAPYYDDGSCVIYHGDALDVLASLGDAVADIAVTSPPYNMGLTPGGGGRGMYQPSLSRKAGKFRGGYEGSHADAMPWDEYDAWQRQCIEAMLFATRLGVYYNNRSRVIHGSLRLPLDGNYAGLPLRQMIVWDRGTGIDVNLRHYCTAHELILLFTHDEFALTDHAASGVSDVWRLGMNHDKATAEHPAPFPVSLPARAIDSTGARSVIDPFMGSGTTLVAAKSAGILGIGIEKSERFCEIAATRLAQGSLFGEVAS